MMLSWIPFRATSVESSITMWSKIFNLSSYTILNMRENTYLITTILMLGILLTYFVKQRLLNFLRRHTIVYIASEVLILSIMITMIYVYFSPVRKFIYFQF